MGLYGVTINLPPSVQEEEGISQRYFAVEAEDEHKAREMALDQVAYELCSTEVCKLEYLLHDFDGCGEITVL